MNIVLLALHLEGDVNSAPGERLALRIFLNLRLLRNFQGVTHFDAEVSHRRFKLGMPEQQLNGAQVLGAPVNQSHLGSLH